MPAWLAAILQTVLTTAAEIARGWIDRERAEADAWARRVLEGQRESAQRVKLTERAIAERAAAAPAPTTPEAWNAGAVGRGALLAAVLLACGCTRYVYRDPALPLIPKPERPVVATLIPFTDREIALAAYAARLEAAIDAYNDHAAAENARNGY